MDTLADAHLGEYAEDVPPEPLDDAISAAGDIWLLGDHRLMCGDSAKRADVDRLLAGARIQLVNTDCPYNVRVEPRSNNAIAAGLSGIATAGVDAAPGNTLIVEGMPSTLVAGVPVTVTIRYLDPFGNPAIGPVQFGSNDPLAILPVGATFTPADGGVKQFTITLQSTGQRTVTIAGDAGASAGVTATVTPSAAVTLP